MTSTTIDIIILVILFLGFAHGYRKGVIVVLGTLVSGIVGVFAASWGLALIRANLPSGPWEMMFNQPLVNGFVFLACFLLATKLLGFVVSLIDSAWSLLSIIPLFGPANRILGGVAGVAVAATVLVVATYMLDGGAIALFGGEPEWYKLFLASRAYPYLHLFASFVSIVLPKVTALV